MTFFARAPLAWSLWALTAACAYDWSLPEGGGGGGEAGAGGVEGATGQQSGGAAGEGSTSGAAGAQGAQGEGGPQCEGAIDPCVQAVCGERQPRRCAPEVCKGLSSADCVALVCGRGVGALACVTQLCLRHREFCRAYDD